VRFPAYRVYLAFSAATALAGAAFGTLSGLYRVQTTGLDPLQLVLIGTALELTVFLFEVPTGIVADLYSRKLSVLIGFALIGAGFALEGAVPLFSVMLFAQIVWGLGYTFTSGVIDAWLSDEIGSEAANRAFLRATQIQQLAGFAGIGLSVALGSLYLGLPMIVGGGIYLVSAVALIFTMPERGFRPHPEATREPFSAVYKTLGAGLRLARRTPVILTIFVITALLGASSETFDRLSEAHFLQDIGLPEVLSPALWFGLIAAASSLLAALVTEVVRRHVDTNAHIAVARALFGINVLLTLSVLGFGLAGDFALALAFYGSAVLLRITAGPLHRAWLNQSLEPRTRATVFSINGQMDALGQIAGGPILGLLARSFGMPIIFVAASLLLLPARGRLKITLT
jgi:DHA3 family tetracycline resistance protein-like MFS transporter